MMKKKFGEIERSRTTYGEDIDDETFLRGSRASSNLRSPISTQASFSHHSQATLDNAHGSLEEHKTQLVKQRKELENRALQSTLRSQRMLQESEDVGTATAEELLRQREQLENTNSRLDDIHVNLQASSKHIQGISSIFGSIKNYWGSRKSTTIDKSNVEQGTKSPSRAVSVDGSSSRRQLQNVLGRANTHVEDVDEHPAMRLKGLTIDESSNSPESFDEILDKNLDGMLGSITRLKGLAEGLGQELDSQNVLLENITTKTDKADANIVKQNKDINRILKK